ncbi:MAG: PilW family protein [Nitrospira sp.]|nr:PilW family protein [Nitrospira sp.]
MISVPMRHEPGERSIASQRGFTLTEIMVATMMTAAIIAAGLGALTVTQKTARITNQVVNTQSTARNGLDMITADLKLAGFGMQGLMGGPVGNCVVNGTPAALVPFDNTPTGPDSGPDRISMVVPMTNSIDAVGPLWQLFPPAPGTIGGPGQPITTLPLVNGATTGMGAAFPGGSPALTGMSVTVAGVAGSRIVADPAGSVELTLSPPIPAPATFGAGTQVYLLQCITYQVIPPPDPNNLCQGNAPCLVRGVAPVGVGGPPNCNQAGATNCIPIMDGVEDLQLAYACDGCNININSGDPDGAIDDMNGSNSFDQGDFLTDINWFLPPNPKMTTNKIRMAQVSIVARQTRTDQGMGEGMSTLVQNTNTILTISDHNHATGVFTSGDNNTTAQQQDYLQFRRRVLTRTVELRNQRS